MAGTERYVRNSTADFLVFTKDSETDGIEVRVQDHEVWLTQKGIGQLFDVDRSVVAKHLRNIFAENELSESTTCAKFAQVADNGKTYHYKFYSLPAIIAVGYRTNSTRATQFRQWATKVLDTFTRQGYVLDKDRLINGQIFDEDYFDHLVSEIQEIRASERRFYQKITDIYATAVDYSVDSKTTKDFFSLNADNSLVSSDFRFIPKNFTLRNYVAVFTEEPVMLWFKNSMTLAVVTVVISLAAAIPAAYAFSRMRFKGRKPILKQLVLLYSFPSVLSMFAIYTLLRPLGLINSKVGLILIYTGTMAEFGLLNMKGYFDTIPREIEEAAEIDGASGIQLVTRIVLPLARPSILVTAVMILIYVWNEYLFATTFMTGAENYTLAAGLYSLQATEMSGSWPVFAAASLVVSLPILIVFFAVQRHMTSGLTAGGVKG